MLSSGPKAVFNLFLPCKLRVANTCARGPARPRFPLPWSHSLSCIYLLNACCGQDEAVHCVHTPYCTMAGYRNKTDTGATKPREENSCETHRWKKCVTTAYARVSDSAEAACSDNDCSSQEGPVWKRLSGANQALCLGVRTIPHKGREARMEVNKGCLGAASLPAFFCFFNCLWSPMSPYSIFFRVTSFFTCTSWSCHFLEQEKTA